MSDGTKLVPPPSSPAPSPALPTAREPEMRKPSPKVRAAIELLLADPKLTIPQAAKAVGLARQVLWRALDKDHVINFVHHKTRRKLTVSQIAAAARMTKNINAKSEHIQHRSSAWILESNGIGPVNQPQVAVNVEVTAGWVIDLAPANEAERLAIERERQAKIIDVEPIEPKAD